MRLKADQRERRRTFLIILWDYFVEMVVYVVFTREAQVCF
jgi:hypothetical protein